MWLCEGISAKGAAGSTSYDDFYNDSHGCSFVSHNGASSLFIFCISVFSYCHERHSMVAYANEV